MNLDIKCLVLDLDGTVLHSDKSISDFTITVLEKCKEIGILIAVATARSEKAAERYLEKIRPDIVISNGGALVRKKEQVIYDCKIPSEAADKITSELIQRPEFLSISLETATGYYVTWKNAYSSDYLQAIHYDFNTPLSQEAYKITVEITNAKIVQDTVRKYPICSMTAFSDGDFYRIAHKNADKTNAINETLNFLNLNLTQVAAFGDDYIDIDMLNRCGVGVAMDNAIPEVKQAADYICDTNDNDGVAKWISNSILKRISNNRT